ncbi:2-amino-5-chloromuconate deaminase CnbZ [Pseudorhodoplanes sinuspersici]|uniref:Uncharacterized protein n=1 Tax=Pseudorhodoplanes sinuspersici TaxID=1235591 RepID=A0A1W6ZZ73_9HYPH|nr:hypothetical protein [Pseudorhodoplanes sinuspersici]ARQ02568.1 hypothetical protein CAK95_28240 [Pseudorhodoplanes sinuspersici]RKE74419.1 hypothetical protein DFP91_2330 [Pseudorhodoplanes sinuspersici]
MTGTAVFVPGGYRYIPAVFQYSAGVAAEDGFELERVRFLTPVPLAEAFGKVEEHLTSIGRPFTAFAHCELRSPSQFTDQGFIDFNKQYVLTLERWGIYKDGVNPVARTNVCPMYDEPTTPSMFAFTYTVPAAKPRRRSFMLSGGGDVRAGTELYKDRIVRFGDTSPEGLREKVAFVIAEMERRLKLLGFGWRDAVSTQAYTVQNIGHLVGEELARRGAMTGGLVWSYVRPPVIGLEYEMDVRGAARELIM